MLGKLGDYSGLGDATQQSFKWCQGSSHTIRTAKSINLWIPFNQSAIVLEHELQQSLGTQTLSSSMNLQQKIQFISFSHVF